MRKQLIALVAAAGALIASFMSLPQIASADDGAQHRIAVVYFSKADGNTRTVADAVKHFTQADIFRVETVEPYPEQYTPTTEVVKKEIDEGIVRELKPLTIDLSKYDTVVLASPTWWHHIASPLETWIKSVDLTDKLVLTCNTHGGGGVMETRKDFERLLQGGRLGTHLSTFGAVDPDSQAVRMWLDENGVL